MSGDQYKNHSCVQYLKNIINQKKINKELEELKKFKKNEFSRNSTIALFKSLHKRIHQYLKSFIHRFLKNKN